MKIAFVSPGWPIGSKANGIITYLNNLIPGFSNYASVCVLAQSVNGDPGSVETIDLSTIRNGELIANNLLLKPRFIFRGMNLQRHAYTLKHKQVPIRISSAVKMISSMPDIIEIEESYGRGRYLKKMVSVPIVTRIHGPWFIHGKILNKHKGNDYKFRVDAEFEGLIRSNGITAPSMDVLEKVRDHYNCAFENSRVIPNPIPVYHEHWRFNPDSKPSLLFVGRFDNHKGGDIAIDAFRLIATESKDVELNFVGPDRGVTKNGQEYSLNDYIKSFVPEKQIRNRIHWLGQLDPHVINKLRLNCWVTLITSRYDNFPMSALEALAFGTPVVAVNSGGLKEMIEQGENGLLVENRVEDIADATIRLLAEPATMQHLSTNAIRSTEAKYSPEIVAKQTLEYYRQVLDSEVSF